MICLTDKKSTAEAICAAPVFRKNEWGGQIPEPPVQHTFLLHSAGFLKDIRHPSLLQQIGQHAQHKRLQRRDDEINFEKQC